MAKLKISGFILLFLCLFSKGFCDETLTITTYYPSPYGSYNELQLYPHASPVTPCNNPAARGTMYYNSTDDQIRTCNGTSWQPVASGGAPSGAVMFFNLAACPAGWTELTSARGRYVVGLPSGGTLAGTDGTALANQEDRPVGQHSHTLRRAGGNGYSCQGFKWVVDAYCPWTYDDPVSTAGSTPGTNAPYIQLLACQKD